jgi:4-hydroxyphenylpyruvate dioxygenase-like putative hemolysin
MSFLLPTHNIKHGLNFHIDFNKQAVSPGNSFTLNIFLNMKLCSTFNLAAVCITALSNAYVHNLPRHSFSHNSKRVATTELCTATSPSIISSEQHQQIHKETPPTNIRLAFSHVQLYTDHLDDLSVYKELESNLSSFGNSVDLKNMHLNIEEHRSNWKDNHLTLGITDDAYVSQGRDIVKQLVAGLGFRITAVYENDQLEATKNLLLTTRDPHGVQFIISSIVKSEVDEQEMHLDGKDSDNYRHFHSSQIEEFYEEHSDRQGIAVLAFQVTGGEIDSLHQNYQALHPDLLTEDCHAGVITYAEDGIVTKVLEVYSYYKNEKGGEVDKGTRLRFVQRMGVESDEGLILPGFVPVEATFDKSCMPAYCDHWVSNVISRTGFLETLEETLGFTPKVDFNAGVVAAGEAQIESTVTGNDSDFVTDDKETALKDQSQVFLPINNALNEFSHVHGFLDEIGQGIQHVASRVEDLPAFVQRGNDFREITGEGFTFLKIPRSYYGVLTAKLLKESVGLSNDCVEEIIDCCDVNGIMSMEGAVSLQLTSEELKGHLKFSNDRDSTTDDEINANLDAIIETILRSRYVNMYNLLGDSLTEETYLSIVRNAILVDVQGSDLLYQIFTSNILQKKAGDESPFLEFIQRVCADCNDDGRPMVMKAGCGGFGIRNFLTLFLSIEIGKAMLEVSHAKASNDDIAMNFAQKKVDAFTQQLNESNPILTAISDAMTEEGVALGRMQNATARGDEVAAAQLEAQMIKAADVKHDSNMKLMELNSKYNDLMKTLRLDNALLQRAIE